MQGVWKNKRYQSDPVLGRGDLFEVVEGIFVMQYGVRTLGTFYEPVQTSWDPAMEDKNT